MWSTKLQRFLVSPKLLKNIQTDNQILEKTKRRTFTVSWIKKVEFFWKKLISARTQLQMSNRQFSPRELSKAWSLILRPEIMGIIISLFIYLILIFPADHLSAIPTGVEAKTKIKLLLVCTSSSRGQECTKSWTTSSWLEDIHSSKTTATLPKLRKEKILQRLYYLTIGSKWSETPIWESRSR